LSGGALVLNWSFVGNAAWALVHWSFAGNDCAPAESGIAATVSVPMKQSIFNRMLNLVPQFMRTQLPMTWSAIQYLGCLGRGDQ
jgi:hypothetical protein